MPKGPRIKLTRHIHARMAQRGISIDVLRATIRKPDRTEPAYGGRTKARKVVGNFTYVAIYKQLDGNEVLAVTIYIL